MSGTSELLRSVPLLRGLDPVEIERLGELAIQQDYADGEALMHQGEPGNHFFLIVDGTVTIQRNGRAVARRGAGDHLGEISLLDGRPRTATVVAEGPVRVLMLDRRDFDRLLDEHPAIAHQLVGTLVDRLSRAVTVPQFGIFAQGTNSHTFLEWDLRPDVDLREAAVVLGRLRSPRVSAGGINLVLGFGPDLWRSISPDEPPDGLRSFERVGLPGGHHVPATQHDLWLWINGSSQDVVFEHARAAARAIETVAELASEQVAFVHRNSQDLTGFIDGTANPTLLEAPEAALVPDGAPGAGGSHVMVIRWIHDLAAFHALPVAEQERVIGRTKADSRELPEGVKPLDAHIARTEIHDTSGNEEPIYRRSVPYGTVAEHGLQFVAFAADRARFDRMLSRMYGTDGDGIHDRLIEFSRAVSGAFYYAPPLNVIADLPSTVAPEAVAVE
jgi:putative iron-dependent peroxidase